MAIKEIRKAVGLSQEALAKESGVARISIARYEAGERIPNIETAARIAKALNCKVDDLLNDS